MNIHSLCVKLKHCSGKIVFFLALQPKLRLILSPPRKYAEKAKLEFVGSSLIFFRNSLLNSKAGHTLKLVGLTGGPGCGKSKASEYFRALGVGVVDADRVCAGIYEEKDNEVLAGLRMRWGGKVFSPDGAPDKKAIARIVFDSSEERRFLDSILHPEIFRRVEKELLSFPDSPFAMIEAPLLFEAGWEKNVFRVVTVWADKEIRMQRLLERGWTLDHAEKRIASQIPDDKKLAMADYGIINSSSLEFLQEQCVRVWEMLLRDSRKNV